MNISNLIDELNALQKHVVMMVLVHRPLIHKVPRLQRRVI